MGTDYQKGYAAGRRRRKSDDAARAFWQRAFLAILPAAFRAQGWTRGGKPIISLDDRVTLASEFADSALKQAQSKGRI